MDKPGDGTSSAAAVPQGTVLASSRIQDRDLDDIRPSIPESNATPAVTPAPGPVAIIPSSLVSASTVPSLGTVASNLGNVGTSMGPNGAAIGQSGSIFMLGSPLSLSTSLVPTTTWSPLGSNQGSQPGSNHSSNPATGPTATPAPAPTPTVATPSSTGPAGMGSPYATPMNQISMPYIKRHAVKRVKSAKEAANAELAKVIHSVTNYFEERLGEKEREEAEELYAKAQAQQQYMRDQHFYHSQSPQPHQSPQGHSYQGSTYQSPNVSAPPSQSQSQSQSHFHSHQQPSQHSHTHHQPSHLSNEIERRQSLRSQSNDPYGSDGGDGRFLPSVDL